MCKLFNLKDRAEGQSWSDMPTRGSHDWFKFQLARPISMGLQANVPMDHSQTTTLQQVMTRNSDAQRLEQTKKGKLNSCVPPHTLCEVKPGNQLQPEVLLIIHFPHTPGANRPQRYPIATASSKNKASHSHMKKKKKKPWHLERIQQ